MVSDHPERLGTFHGARPRVRVEVRMTTDPAGRWAVLLRLPWGWVTLLPDDAREIARELREVAGLVDEL